MIHPFHPRRTDSRGNETKFHYELEARCCASARRRAHLHVCSGCFCMKKFAILFFLLLATAAQAVIVTVDPWVPIFKGIELAHGRQQKESAGEREHQVYCLRVDLSDPDVKLLTTPHCTNGCAGETLSENARGLNLREEDFSRPSERGLDRLTRLSTPGRHGKASSK